MCLNKSGYTFVFPGVKPVKCLADVTDHYAEYQSVILCLQNCMSACMWAWVGNVARLEEPDFNAEGYL